MASGVSTGAGIPSPGDPSFLDGLKTPGRCGLSRSSSYNLSKLETCPSTDHV